MRNRAIGVAFVSMLAVCLAILAFAFMREHRAVADIPPSFATFGSTTLLSTGRSMTFEDGLRATLTTIGDSRCPKDVQCIWQGELSPVLELSEGALDVPATVTLGTERTRSATAGPYAVTLVDATAATATFVIAKTK